MPTYLAQCTGQRVLGNTVLGCPTCGTDRGLAFTASNASDDVTGSCPNGHVWDERRYPAAYVREDAIDSARRH